jgi:hypothetical protein
MMAQSFKHSSAHRPLRVLHGPYNVGNQPWVLSRAERRLGVRSDLVVTSTNWLSYPADRILFAPGRNLFSALVSLGSFAPTALFRYDVLHYYFGRSYLNQQGLPLPLTYLDLKLARLLGRKVFMTLQGCDVRQSEASAQRNPMAPCRLGHCSRAPLCRSKLDSSRRRLIHDILPLCDRVFVLNPDLAYDVPGATFLPYASVNVEGLQPVPPHTEGPIVVLHAPTDDGIKGTSRIRAAIQALSRRWPVELVLVQRVPHHEALKLYARADLIIDQVLAGWYGGFAVEAMALGKPVGCYLRDADLACLPPTMRAELPLVRLHPLTLEHDLERAFRLRAEWPAWGRRSRAFVLRWHHPFRIAQAMIDAYRDPGSRFSLESEACSAAA